jgi:hypothetical protein
MQRIQYQRYSGPEEMRLETDKLAALGEYLHDRRAIPARHRHGFFRRSGKHRQHRRGEFIPMLRMCWPKETSTSTDAEVLGFRSGHTPGLNLVDAHASAAP